MLFLNIIYVLLAVGMIVLILMQRGAGAQAGSGFGGGASGTVFGARGSSNFLSKSTKWLAITFFALSLGISWTISHSARKPDADNGSIMAQVPGAPAQVPAAPAGTAVPVAPVSAPVVAPSIAPAAAPGSAAPAQPATNSSKPPSTGG